MSLAHEVHAQFEEVGNHVHHILAVTALGENNIEEAWAGLRVVGVGSTAPELPEAVSQLEIAYAALAEARTILSEYTDIINPYLERVGMPLLSTSPPIPEQAPLPAQEVIRRKPGPKKKERPPEEPPKDKYLARTEPYAERLATIRDDLDAGKDPRTIEGYIDSGDEYHVFNNGDGTVLKVPRDRQFDHIFPDYERALAEIVKGNASFEQILGFSTEQGGAFLAGFVSGQAIEDLADSKLAHASQRHYNTLARAIGFAVRHGLSIEYRSTATMYDPEKGFVFIDNAIGNTPSDSQHDIDMEARMALVMFGLGEADQKTACIEQFKQAFLRVYPDSRLRYDWDWKSLGA